MGKVEDKVKKYLDKIKKEDGKINSFLYVNPNAVADARAVDAKKGKKGRLYGQVIGVKSVICVKDMVCSAGSKVLDGWKAPYDATVVEKIKAEDGVIIGMLNCDEFACGWSGETSAFGVTQNPSAPGKVPGGSSSGSAAAVAAGFCDVSLGTDTGGSIRNPASHCGVVGIKPSYGLVSRYGLMDMCMSLDTIGTMAKNVEDAALVLDVIRGKDDRDTTTTTFEKGSRSPKSIKLEKPGKIKMGVVNVKGVDKRIQKLVDSKIEELVEKKGWKVEDVDMKYIDLTVQTYYLLVYAEMFSASRKFDGRRFGKVFEEACGEEVLRRVLGGSEITKEEVAGDYYKRALGVKKMIEKEFERVLKGVDATASKDAVDIIKSKKQQELYDCLVMPVFPMFPWDVGGMNKIKLEEVYAADALTIPASLAGICGISVPIGEIEDIPFGMQVMCGKGEEGKMLSIARELTVP